MPAILGASQAFANALQGYNTGLQMQAEQRMSLERMQQQAALQSAAAEQEQIHWEQKQQFMQGLREEQQLNAMGFERTMDRPTQVMFDDALNKRQSLIGMVQEGIITQEKFYEEMGRVHGIMRSAKKTVRPKKDGTPTWLTPSIHSPEELPPGHPMRDILMPVINGKRRAIPYTVEANGRFRPNHELVEAELALEQKQQDNSMKLQTEAMKLTAQGMKSDADLIGDILKESKDPLSPSAQQLSTDEGILQEAIRRRKLTNQFQAITSGQAPVPEQIRPAGKVHQVSSVQEAIDMRKNDLIKQGDWIQLPGEAKPRRVER